MTAAQPAPDLSVTLGKLSLKNPVMTASGTFGYGEEFADYVDIARLGAVVVKGLSLAPRRGNPPPRIMETPCGMLNAVGLQNVGVEAFLADKLPYLKDRGATVVANVYGESVEEYARVCEKLSVPGIAAIEVNVSCPNVKKGGVSFGTDPDMAAEVTAAARAATDLPLIVKLTPNVTDITVIARSVAAAGADAVSLINTLTGMAINAETRRPSLANITGGLSGPAIKPVALRMVWQTARAVAIPVIGLGGIVSADDAVEFLLAGASAIQVGTANFVCPGATAEILEGLEAYLRRKQIPAVSDLVGALITD